MIGFNSIFQFFKLEAESKGLKLSYHKQNIVDQLTIETDKNKYNSILTNLVKNAIKYTDSGEIEILVTIDKNDLLCTVKDTGIGIP